LAESIERGAEKPIDVGDLGDIGLHRQRASALLLNRLDGLARAPLVARVVDDNARTE
jgi:hypothetical protein